MIKIRVNPFAFRERSWDKLEAKIQKVNRRLEELRLENNIDEKVDNILDQNRGFYEEKRNRGYD